MRKVKVSVRTLVEFSYLTGSLEPGARAAKRMREGTEQHIIRQRSYPESWQSEIPVQRTVTVDDIELTVQGRIDGMGMRDGYLCVEEIKSAGHDPSLIGRDTKVHFMQGAVYAALLDTDATLEVDIVYVRGSGEKRFRHILTHDERERLFDEAVMLYVTEIRRRLDARDQAMATAAELAFPYEDFRAGQEKLIKHAEYALRNSRKLLVQAPTGIGKTMAALYPALKVFGSGDAERIFYLTARTTQRLAAEDALQRLRAKGLFIRSVTITAKERICFCPDGECSGSLCPYADGFFDRIGAALADSSGTEVFDRAGVEALARKHTVCPFELSLELAEQAEAVICDYNYAFDPNVRLKRFFDRRSRSILLIDEAHELPDRVSGMLSAELDTATLKRARARMGRYNGKDCPGYAVFTELMTVLQSFEGTEDRLLEELPEDLMPALDTAAEILKDYMPFPDRYIGDAYFGLLDLRRAARAYDAGHTCIMLMNTKGGRVLRLWRFDPSGHIRDTLAKVKGTLLFSATLTPMKFYAALCGMDKEKGDAMLSVPGPFPKENRLVLNADVSMRYNDRERAVPMAAAYADAMVKGETGNYIVFCPSYALMGMLADAYEAFYPETEILRQGRSMTDEERGAVLDRFVPHPVKSLVLFAVLGGIFAEGIDLPGDRLTGVAVVSVGLPQFGFERNALASFGPPAGGYEAAYIYPSVTRVAQAAGRLIRTETDKGVLLLIDDRYSVRPFTQLYKKLWRGKRVTSVDMAAEKIRSFWENGGLDTEEDWEEWQEC